MNTAYLLIGGNIGEREKYLDKAGELIDLNCGEIVAHSDMYETAAWGKTDQAAFLNQALQIETSLSAPELMHCILQVEKKMGRVREEKYGERVIDIDIIFYNDEIYKTDNLIIPHPEMQNRRFVLVPLAGIAAGHLHPVLKKTIAELLELCTDKLEVKKYKI
jgi:2-amino-4-hydroxy-6-hydroxymethyldihydropteridine diphosphokinase